MIKKRIKKLIVAVPLFLKWYKKGYFNKAIRRQRIVNFFFKVFLRVNADCPWSVHFTSKVGAPQNIKIEEGEFSSYVYNSFLLSGNCYIQGGNGIEFGEGTLFAPGVKIISANHSLKDYSKWEKDTPIKIGKFCWIGANAVILPGVILGDYTVVGAGSVVTRSFPSYVIVGGSPAKIIGYRCKNCGDKLSQKNEKLICDNCGSTYKLEDFVQIEK